MHPSFEQFVAALRDPSLRSGIGLAIGEADAAALLTRQEWANDYYYKWLALFPVAAAAAFATPAGVPASEPVAASVFGGPPPPPSTLPVTSAAPHWEYAPAASRIPTAAKMPLIVGGSVLGVALLTIIAVSVVSGLVIPALQTRPAAVTATHSASAPATTAAGDPDTHGLTPEEYQLLEVVVAPSGHSVEEAVANGTTDAQLRVIADKLKLQLADTCTGAQKVPQGFDSAAFKAAFIAGYTVQQKVTADQAAAVYTALGNYCLSSP